MHSGFRARSLILASALLFSTGGAAIKATTLDSWQVAGFRSGVAALALWLFFPSWRRFWQPDTLLVGGAYAATLILYVTANKLTTAANAIFLQSTAPLWVLLLGPWLLGERARPADLGWVAAFLVGLGLFFAGTSPPLATAPDPLLGDLMAVGSGVVWGLTLLGLRKLARDDADRGTSTVGAAVVAGNLIALLVCLPFALPVTSRTATDWTVIAYLGLFQIGLAYVCMTARRARDPRPRGLPAAPSGAGAQRLLGLGGPRGAPGRLGHDGLRRHSGGERRAGTAPSR